MMPEWKERLEQRFASHPFLLMLVLETRFRIAFIGLALCALLIPLGLIKLWRTTPPGFQPAIRISLLDHVQAWSLKRSGLKAAAEGRWEQAQHCLEAACANDPGSPELARRCLQLFIDGPEKPELLDRAAGRAFWLLKLTQTNAADLVLTGRALAHLGSPDDLAALLSLHSGALPLELEALLGQARIETGHTAEFLEQWRDARRRFPQGGDGEGPGLLDMVRRALEGGDADRTAAIKALQVAARKPALARQASRALLALAVERRDSALAEDTLAKWGSEQPPELQDFVILWRLLASVGRSQEARSLALAWKKPPSNPRELLLLVKGRMETGAREAALETCREGIDRLGATPEVWLTYGLLTLELRQWEALRPLAVRMRVHGGGSGLEGFAYYLEGRAELGLGQFDNAPRSFAKAAAASYTSPRLALAVATELLKVGYPAEALVTLRGVQERLKNDASFWTLMFEAADIAKDVGVMREAIEKAYALSPSDPIILNNYAATLLIQRDKPELAAKLTLSLLSRNPGAVEPIVNHAEALLMNRRVDEAAKFLQMINPAKLNAAQSTLYHLDLLEIELERGRIEEARRAAARIQTDHLYPPQRLWLSNALQRLAEKP